MDIGVGGTEIKGQSSTLPIGAGIAARSSDPRTGKKRESGGVLQRDLALESETLQTSNTKPDKW